MIELRDYQAELDTKIDAAWARGDRRVCAVLPTGGGKTILFGNKLAQEPGVRFAIAHRQELIYQMSMALCKFGITHDIQAPADKIRWIVREQTKAYGRHYYAPSSPCILISVQTLTRREYGLARALKLAKLWVIDECHHVTRGNIWGSAVSMFPETCRGLGVTATPVRTDGKGLGAHADGVMDTMVTGPDMRDLINRGYLSDYRVFAPATNIDLSGVTIGATGDYSKPKLVAAVRKSKIVGDVVAHYLKLAAGKLGVTFVTDVETGRDVTARFNAAGVPAGFVHAKTADRKRQDTVAAFRRGELKQLVNVDIFGEGFDLPAVEVGSMARPTQSYGLFSQQFGRTLRTMEGKGRAIILDHVGNTLRHGMPDFPREWTLDARDKRPGSGRGDVRPVRVCRSCTGVYEVFRKVCPYCGHFYAPDSRASIEQVEGDLFEMSPEVLGAMRAERDRIDGPDTAVGSKLMHAGASDIAAAGAIKNHRLRKEAQAMLRAAIVAWVAPRQAQGLPDHLNYREFYEAFGIDVLGAQLLGRRDAEQLTKRIQGD